jgi:23S rRNA (adenine2030-N6)-methyltransferase
MLSYRHAFHAGNHADVLKHLVLLALLDHLATKNKPFWYIDTHAGAGMYRLRAGYAAQRGEFDSGIGRLWNAPDLPRPVASYVDSVRALNPTGLLRCYPGSPALARSRLRPGDRMWLYELHPADYALLEREFAPGQGTRVQSEDGFAALKALLPPAPRRALVLLDPPYERRDDYRQLTVALGAALERFATGIYLAWLPLIPRQESRELPARLKSLGAARWLYAELRVKAPGGAAVGLFGSGVFVINPPHTLPETLRESLRALSRLLAQDAHAGFDLKFEMP